MQTIVSGGQTGADRAALDAAIESGFACGGYCPGGRLAEDGPIPSNYPLTEIDGGYEQRTKANLLESSGTAIFYDTFPIGGTELTLSLAISHHRPYRLVDISATSPEAAAVMLHAFVSDSNFVELNVAGPRESTCPAIYDFVRDTIRRLIGLQRASGGET